MKRRQCGGENEGAPRSAHRPFSQPERRCKRNAEYGNWSTKGLYQGGRAEMDGFTPGGIVWVRVRTVGLKGVMGAWSDPAQIRVL